MKRMNKERFHRDKMEARSTGRPRHQPSRENVFQDVYQWNDPTEFHQDNMMMTFTPEVTFTAGAQYYGYGSQQQKSWQTLQKNLIQLLKQFQPNGIPVKNLWKVFQKHYKYEPRPSKYGVAEMNHILPQFTEFIGIDYSPHGPMLVLTQQGENEYRKEFCSEDAVNDMSAPQRSHRQVSHSISYSQVATLSGKGPRQMSNGYQPFAGTAVGYQNIHPITKETLAHAASIIPKEQGHTVRSLLAEPDCLSRAKAQEEEILPQHRAVIKEFSTNLTEMESIIQKNIIAILAEFHPDGVPVRSIWGVYKKRYRSTPTKQDIADANLNSINEIFERFSAFPTANLKRAKSIQGSMNFVLTDRGEEYAVKLDLLQRTPQMMKNIKEEAKSDAAIARQRLQGSSTG